MKLLATFSLALIIGLSNSSGQDLKLFVNDNQAIVSEQTKFVKTIDGIGISFMISDTIKNSDYLEIEIMHQSPTGSLLTLKKSRINNYKNKFSDNQVRIWYSDNWLQNAPRGFIPLNGIQIPEKFITEELNVIVFVYTGEELTAKTYAGSDRVYKRKSKRQMLLSSETFKIFQREWTTLD